MIQQIEKQLKADKLSEKVYTENGAIAHSTSGTELVDFNFKVSSYRNADVATIITDFDKVWNEDKNLAIKMLFFIRDVREGLGERRLFRVIFKHLIDHLKDDIYHLFPLVAEYGRYDDLIEMIDLDDVYAKDANKEIARVLKKQMDEDVDNMRRGVSISLLCKWLPSSNASSKRSHLLSKFIRNEWGNTFSEKFYRKLLAEMRKYLKVTEIYTSANNWSEINYEQVPSMANIKYKTAFLKHDRFRRQEFLEKLSKGEVTVNSSVAFPHDIVHQYYATLNEDSEWNMSSRFEFKRDDLIEGMWNNQKQFNISDTLVVADGSGSMLSTIGGTKVMAIEVANALAVYCAEHNQSVFKDKYITFSSRPQLVDLSKSISGKKNSLADKLNICNCYSEVSNTNIEAVFDLILRTAVNNKMKQSELVKQILIVSDMGFDAGTTNKDFLFDEIAQKWSIEGYILPKLIWWNCTEKANGIPIIQNEAGLAFLGGFSLNAINMVMSGEVDAYKCIKDVLDGERYKNIKLLG